MDKIEINLGRVDDYYIKPLYKSLDLIKNKFNFILKISDKEPERGIFLNDKLVALVDFSDGQRIWRYMNDYPEVFVFKWQYSRDYDYGSRKMISAGYFSPLMFKQSYLKETKEVDITARMRVNYTREHNINREKIVDVAKKLKEEGFKTTYGKIDIDLYLQELGTSNIGFNWRGKGCLNFRIIEYIQNEVIMISDELGEKFPIRDDVILENNKHYLACSNPEDFYSTSKNILRDTNRQKELRNNIKKLWKEKLCPEKTGEWYYKKIKELENK